MITKVTLDTLQVFGIDEPVSELKCTECNRAHDLAEWKQKLMHGLYEFKRWLLICPNCKHEHDPYEGDVPRYYI